MILFTQLQYGACTFMSIMFYKFVYFCCLRMYKFVIVIIFIHVGSIWMSLSEINYQSIL